MTPAASGVPQEPTTKCEGSATCGAPLHVHGCYADTEGRCDNPTDHDAHLDSGVPQEPTDEKPECACGEWRLTPLEIAQGWHVRSEHHPDCTGRCDECPVQVQCGPIRTASEHDAAKEADVDAAF